MVGETQDRRHQPVIRGVKRKKEKYQKLLDFAGGGLPPLPEPIEYFKGVSLHTPGEISLSPYASYNYVHLRQE